MTIEPGQMLGHYRVAEKIGEGGMGVVYRAEDSKLGRPAAIKILPAEVASDPERLARFEREARVLASLSHPNIASIYGLEQEGDVRFLALEMVEGVDLFQMLKEGPIPVDEALKMAAQVAAALESAHESGVIHRDLKPSNIKVSPGGRVKVLDFGLAKSFTTEAGAADLTRSPTLTSPATRHGVILGTAPYMSPEQARGKPVDRRTDVWAFGCVLYEMLARRPAFHGETVTDTFAKILEREPDWSALPPGTPEPVRRMLARYLTKDPDRRLKDLGYARIVIDEVLSGTGPGSSGALRAWGGLAPDGAALPPASPAGAGAAPGSGGLPSGPASWGAASAGAAVDQAISGSVSEVMHTVRTHVDRELSGAAAAGARPRARWTTPVVGFTVILAALAGFLSARLAESVNDAPERTVAHASIVFPEEARIDTSLGSRIVALSPDGSRVALIASREGVGRIYYRELGKRSLSALEGTENAASIFFSPDGEWIGFWADDFLKKVSVATGQVVPLAKTRSQRGGAWSTDGTIYFPLDQLSGIYEVGASGGEPRPVTALDEEADEMSHRWPELLPGERALLVNVERPGSFDNARIDVVDLETGERRPVAENGMSPSWSPTGHVLFVRQGHLVAVPFDPEALEATGPEIRLSDEILTYSNSGAAQYEISGSGTLAYLGQDSTLHRRLVRVSWDGRIERLTEEPRAIFSLSLSPDGRRAALCLDNSELWIFERDRATLTRLTSHPATDQHPLWSPDGEWIVFSSTRSGALNLWRKRADGSGVAERLTESPNDQIANSFTPDGRKLLYSDESPREGWRLFQMQFTPFGETESLVDTPYEEVHMALTPDGEWAAFSSTSSGAFDIFVTPYPGPGGRWQISNNDSYEPARWGPDGRTVYFRSGTRIMAVDFTPGDPPVLSAPRPVFEQLVGLNTLGSTFAFEPDGSGFLTLQESPTSARLDLALNWTETLRSKAGDR